MCEPVILWSAHKNEKLTTGIWKLVNRTMRFIVSDPKHIILIPPASYLPSLATQLDLVPLL